MTAHSEVQLLQPILADIAYIDMFKVISVSKLVRDLVFKISVSSVDKLGRTKLRLCWVKKTPPMW